LREKRKSGTSRQGFESLLPGKKHPKLPEIAQIWATFGTTNFFAVLSGFLRVYPFGVNWDYCYGWFFCEIWGFGSERSGSDSNHFFRMGLKIRKSQFLKSGIRNISPLTQGDWLVDVANRSP
jgi:hypothetical protein